MRNKVYIFVVLSLVLLAGVAGADTGPDCVDSGAYQLKAAFIYNFIKFVEWPKDKIADGNEPISVGIIGKDPFGNAFEPLKDKKAKGRKIVVKRFKGFEELKKDNEKDKNKLQREIKAIRKCNVLFICCTEKESQREIINSVKANSILTIGESEVFFKSGGIINFLVEDKKVRFEINNTAAKDAKLKISSKLLRLAKRVVKERPPKDTKK